MKFVTKQAYERVSIEHELAVHFSMQSDLYLNVPFIFIPTR